MFYPKASTADKIKEYSKNFIDECKNMVTLATTKAPDEKTPNFKDTAKSIQTDVQKFVENAEREKQELIRQQQISYQINMIQSMRYPLKNMLSYSLSRMPSHLNFWGNVNPHLIHLKFVNSLWQFDLIHSSDAHDMPMHFYNTESQFQYIVEDVYGYACNVLKARIQSDADRYMEQQIYSASNIKTVSDFLQEYQTLYKSFADYLFIISGITMIPIANGVRVCFSATFNDVGLHPNNYLLNVNSVYCI